MTEQEQKAIKWMQNVRDDAVVTLDHIAKEEPNVSPMLYAGRKEKAEIIINGFEELELYRAIGTLEECRAAVEKQTAKKPNYDDYHRAGYRCPTCNNVNPWGYKHCKHCGQKLDWRDENDKK